MDQVKKRLGFGCMRLPMRGDGRVDTEEFSKMVDIFLENGFNYFDTAHGYVKGMSETALRECLTSRYSRDRYILTNKLSTHFFEREEQIRPLFEEQLKSSKGAGLMRRFWLICGEAVLQAMPSALQPGLRA